MNEQSSLTWQASAWADCPDRSGMYCNHRQPRGSPEQVKKCILCVEPPAYLQESEEGIPAVRTLGERREETKELSVDFSAPGGPVMTESEHVARFIRTARRYQGNIKVGELTIRHRGAEPTRHCVLMAYRPAQSNTLISV